MKSDVSKLVLNEETTLYYRTHPVEAARDLLGVRLAWFQRQMLNAMWTKTYILLVLGRGCSKTFIIAVFCVLWAMLHPKTKIGALGPSKRQADLIFTEMEGFLRDSVFFKASIIGKISMSPMRSIVKFDNGSSIEGLPIGQTGSKARGSRFHVICLDEYAQWPKEVLDLVIKPFLAVRKAGRRNKVIEASSAFFKWNHLFDRFKFFRRKTEIEKNPNYYLANYDYRAILIEKDPPFLPDMDIIREMKETMTELDFNMEIFGVFPDESTSYFSSRLIEEVCTPRKINEQVSIETDCYNIVSGERVNNGFDYVLGVDVARQPQGANFTVAVLKIIEKRYAQLVNMYALNGATAVMMIDLIRKCTLNYNVVRINVDAGGGGTFIKDGLSVPWFDSVEEKQHLPILDMDDDGTENISGLRYLRLINFQGKRHSDLFTNMRSEMEHRRLSFPINLRKDPDKEIQRAGHELVATKKELMVLTSVPRGANLHFSAPPGFQSDRATALALALDALIEDRPKDWQEKHEEESLALGFWV